jgi:hypothetical protein
MGMAWFPLYGELIESAAFKRLTPTEKLYFWHLVSEFNRRGGEFYQSDLEMAKTLATSEKTIRRARFKLTKMGLIKVKPGTRTKRNQYLATRYLKVRYATMEEGGFFSQIPRHTFQAMLHSMRQSRLQTGDLVVYICLYYWFWRNRGKNEYRDRFFITKKHLQSLTNMNDALTRLPRIYEAIVFSSGEHLFKYEYEYHRMVFTDWAWFADPDKDEQNRRNAEGYLMEIKDLVTREKQERQLKLQQKIARTSLAPFEFFMESYKKKYGRLPHYNWNIKERFLKIEKSHGYSAIYQAIKWYFTAEMVPNETKAKTRTLGNFITHINDILRLSGNFSLLV